MRVVVFVCLLGLALGSPLSGTFEERRISPETEQKMVDNFNMYCDMIQEHFNHFRTMSVEGIRGLAQSIREMQKAGLDYVGALKTRLNTLTKDLKERIKGALSIFGINFDKPEKSLDIKRIDQDEATKKLIDGFNRLFDLIIDNLEAFRVVPQKIIDEMIEICKDLRERNINIINLINEKIRSAKGYVQTALEKLKELIKKVLGIRDDTHESPVAFAKEEITEEDKVQMMGKLEKLFHDIIEHFKESNLLPLRLFGRIGDLFSEIRDKQLDMGDALANHMSELPEKIRKMICFLFRIPLGLLGANKMC